MKIDKISQQSLTDRVENEIKQAIAQSKLKIGDKLPKEIEFAQHLGVSRNIVREALSRLRMLGVIKSKKNRGMILTHPRLFGNLESIVTLPIISQKTKSELLQIRVICEMGMTDLIFQNKTEEDLMYLDQIVQKEESDAGNLDQSIECDIAFHIRLFEISKNETLQDLHALLRPFITSHAQYFQPNRFQSKDEVTHRDLLNALHDNNIESYRVLIRQHLIRFL